LYCARSDLISSEYLSSTPPTLFICPFAGIFALYAFPSSTTSTYSTPPTISLVIVPPIGLNPSKSFDRGIFHPMEAMTMKYAITQKRIFIVTPASITIILCHLGFLFRFFFSSSFVTFSSRSPSPRIFTYPPKGKALMLYIVSPIFFEKSFGPNPSENSNTIAPIAFAAMKCPNS